MKFTKRRHQQGFTLSEILIATTLFILLVGGIISANLFGMRMAQLNETKLQASDRMRKAFGRLNDEVRNSQTVAVGSVSNGVFAGLLDGQSQIGNGLYIQPSSSSSNYVLYFLYTNDQTFRRTSSATGKTTILASSVTNTSIFFVQDCIGNVLTNNYNSRVIHLLLETLQRQPWLPNGEYCRLETAVTRRLLN
jgi:type II secretory pathway pseudopilin PulG